MTVVPKAVGLVIVALPPNISVHVPVPGDGSFPARVTLVVPAERHRSDPALEGTVP